MTAPLPAPTGTAPATTQARRQTVDRALLAFFLAAYALPWAVWWSEIAEQRGWTTWHLPGGMALWTLLPVTLTAVAATGGRAGLADLGRRMVRWRVPGRWWAAAVGIPLAFAAVATGIGAALSGSAHLGETLSLPASLTYLAYGIGLFLLTEEAAWRGFALPRLMTRLSPLAAALVLGVIWAGWHIPTFLLATESNSAIPYWGFAVMVVATSVITAWLYLGSGSSVLLCAVWHAAADAAYSWTGVVGRDHRAFWAAVIVEILVAAWLAARYGRSLLQPTELAAPQAPIERR
jgi:membrane protease YdiL (CAAX protease family)